MPSREKPAAVDGPTPTPWPPPLHLPYSRFDGSRAVAKLTVYLNQDGEVCTFALDRLGDDTAASARAAYRLGITSVMAAAPGVVRIAPSTRRRARK